jgi:hypothetical protein
MNTGAGIPAQRLSTFASAASLALLAAATVHLLSQQSETSPAAMDKPAQLQHHRQAIPLAAGIDGAETGTASFVGNLTTIQAPPGQALALYRLDDCSLTFVTGSYLLDHFSYEQTLSTPRYELTLHSEAGLSTKPDVFKNGCALEPTPGTGSQQGVFVGTTKTGVNVFACIGVTAPSFNQGVYLLTGKSTFSLSSFGMSTAGNVTAADLNKDGNGDLVVTNNGLATSGFITVFLGNADGTVKQGVNYPTAGKNSVAAAIDDVNGDGKLDIVVASDNQKISILLGKGDGTFEAAKSFALPALPGYTFASETPIVNIITADLRGNGKKDIVGSNGQVLLGNGNGTFTAVDKAAFPYSIATSNQGPNLASGDFNNDGKTDLILSLGGSVSTWIGKGDGTFSAGEAYLTTETTGFTQLNDLDGDGNADIYIGSGNGRTYGGDGSSDANLSYALMGNGDGTFRGAPLIAKNGIYTGTNLGDITGTGTHDLITNGNPGENQGSPVFTVQLGTVKGTFNPVSAITAPASFSLNSSTIKGAENTIASTYAVGDINGDGKADLVFADNNLIQNAFPVYFTALSEGNGTFKTPQPHALPQIAPAGDFDNTVTVGGLQIAPIKKDGDSALFFVFNETAGRGTGPAVTSYNQGILVLPNSGDGTFKAPVLTKTYSSNTAPTSNTPPQILAVEDINGDGNLDLLVLEYNFNLTVGQTTKLELFLGEGDGAFKTPITLDVAPNPTAIAIADFNKDGKLDIAVKSGNQNAVNDQITILLGKGDGTFDKPFIFTTPYDVNGYATIAAADFNGDGNIDLALFNPFEFSGIFYGKGDGAFSGVNINTPSEPILIPTDLFNLNLYGSATAVDLNKDGKPDILVGNGILVNRYGLPTRTALTTSTANAKPGESVTFTAKVAPDKGTETLTGTVTFTSSTEFQTTVLDTVTLEGGKASYSTTGLPLGTNYIIASYSGNADFSGSTSNTLTETVAKTAQTITFKLAASQVTYGVAPINLAPDASASSGLPVSFSVISGPGKMDGTTLTVTGKGSIVIQANQYGNTTYAEAPPVNQTLTVN